MKKDSPSATSPLELAAKLKEIAGNLAMEGFARHDAGILCEAADFLENTHGVLNAWKRDYEGEKERGDAWMKDAKAAEAKLLALSETATSETDEAWYERETAAFKAWWESEGEKKFSASPTMAAGAGWLARAEAARSSPSAIAPSADTILSEIVKDIRARKGIGDEWDQLDVDIRNEIVAEWLGYFK